MAPRPNRLLRATLTDEIGAQFSQPSFHFLRSTMAYELCRRVAFQRLIPNLGISFSGAPLIMRLQVLGIFQQTGNSMA